MKRTLVGIETELERRMYALSRYADPTQLYADAPPMSLTIVGSATAIIVWSRAARNTIDARGKNMVHSSLEVLTC